MGFIRGGLLVIVSVLFFVGMLIANTVYTVKESIDYENVKVGFPEVVNNVLKDEFNTTDFIDADSLEEAEIYCSNNSYFAVEESIEGLDVGINVSCDSINIGEEAIIDEIVDETLDQVYYKDYNCEWVECLQEESNIFYIVSEDFQNYLTSKFYFVFISLIVLFALIFLLTESKANAFIITGILIIVSSLPFLKIEDLFLSIGSGAFKFVGLLFSASMGVFFKVLVIGIIILIIGIILKLFNIGFKISEFFNREDKDKKIEQAVSKEEVKNIVKSDVENSKKQDKAKNKAKKKS